MPYSSIPNEERFVTAMEMKWYNRDQVLTLCQTLRALKYRFESERNAGADAIATFRNGGMKGESIFSDTTQFPDGLRQKYYTCFDVKFASILDTMHHNLTSTRSETAGKDVASSKPAADASVQVVREQKGQDENRAWMANVDEFAAGIQAGTYLWGRKRFESDLCLLWT